MTIRALASGSGGNAYHVTDGRTPLLIECGIPLKEIQVGTGFRLSQSKGVLVSHRHNDHSKAVRDCIRAGVDVYAPKEVFEAKRARGHRCKPVSPFKGFRLGTFSILPFDLEHDCVNYGYLLHSLHSGGRLLYFTDTCMVKYRFGGLTHIMAECNYSVEGLDHSVAQGLITAGLRARLLRTHMGIGGLLEFLRSNDPSRVEAIYLIHLSRNNARAEEFRRAVAGQTGKEVHVCI